MVIKPKELEKKAKDSVDSLIPKVERLIDKHLGKNYMGRDTKITLGIRFPPDWNFTTGVEFRNRILDLYRSEWNVRFDSCYDLHRKDIGCSGFFEDEKTDVLDVEALVIRHKRYGKDNLDEHFIRYLEHDLIDLDELSRKKS